jgi:hypothetical protein
MFSAGIITKAGQILGKAFETKEEAEDFILFVAEKEPIKLARIRNLITREEEPIKFD